MFSLPPMEQKEQDERNQRDQKTMESVRVDSYGGFFLLRPTELGQYMSCFFYAKVALADLIQVIHSTLRSTRLGSGTSNKRAPKRSPEN